MCDLCALRGALEVISRFTAFHCLHCPLSGGPEAHTLTSSEARRATLTVVATLRAQRGPTLSLQVKPMAHTQSGSVATVCSVGRQPTRAACIRLIITACTVPSPSVETRPYCVVLMEHALAALVGCPHIDNNKNYVIVSCLFQVVLCRFQHIPSLILFRSCAQNRGFLRRPSEMASPPCLPWRVSCGRSGIPLALRPARPCSGCRAPPAPRVSRLHPRRQEIRSEPPPPLSQHSLPCLRGTLHKPQPSALSPQSLLLHA